MTEPPAFGDLLRRARLAAGLTQEALAERAGISPRGMGYIERGISRAPQRETVALLAEALGLTGEERHVFEAAARRLAARGAGLPPTLPPGSSPPAAPSPAPDNVLQPTHAPAAPVARLPVPVTSFVGRGRELAEVRRLLGTTRLLTLTGVGGVGKTRLALEVARAVLADYPQGVWLVELAALADGELVAGTVAQALGVLEQADRAPVEVLTAWLRDRHLLLVVDNCEHLLEGCAQVLATLLASCPGLRLLTTSREGLGIGGELTWRVPSLELPAPGPAVTVAALAECEAVRLFAERAAFAQPGFAVTVQNAGAVAAICTRLDGIPLAIELAAAWVRALPVEQVAARLADRFRLLTGGSRAALPRQQTLRATIDWSHELLTAEERVVLRRLAVFAGSWTLAAAEAVCGGAGSDEWAVLEVLARLVDKSMVQYEAVEAAEEGEARYRLLETVRQYAGDRLLEAEEVAAVRDRHRDWYLALAERADPELRARDQHRWSRRLDTERDNLRAALAWCLEHDSAAGLRLAANLAWFWWFRDMYREGRRWLETFLDGVPAPTVVRARALHGLARIARDQGDPNIARERFEAALRLGRELGATAEVVWALRDLSLTLDDEGEHAQARALLHEGLPLSRSLGDRRHIGVTLIYLARTALYDDEVEQARAWGEEGVTHLRQVGGRWSIVDGLTISARVAMAQGRLDQARVLLEEALAITQAVGAPSKVRLDLARLAMLQGQLDQAREQGEAALALSQEVEEPREMAFAQHLLGDIARRRGDLAGAAALLRESLVRFLERRRSAEQRSDVSAIAGWVDRLALVALDRQRAVRAARLLGTAAALRQATGMRPDALDRAELDEAVQAARAALGEAAFAAAWAAGKALTLDEAVAEALVDEPAG